MFPRLCVSLALICFASTAFASDNKGPSLRDKEQAACYGDAQRLCNEFIPDVDKVTACMQAKKSQVSPGCAQYFDLDKAAR